MKRFQWAADEEIEKLNHIEICPTAMDLTLTIAKRISCDGGGALIIDYGLNGVISDSLQVCILTIMLFLSFSFIALYSLSIKIAITVIILGQNLFCLHL